MRSGKRAHKANPLLLTSLPQLTPEDKEALTHRQIYTVEDFLVRRAEDPNFVNYLRYPDVSAKQRIENAIEAGIKQSEIRKQSDPQLEKARSLTKSPFRSHFADGIILLAAVLLAAGILRGCRLESHSPTPTFVASAPNGLMPFQEISRSDITVASAAGGPSADDAATSIAGRYSIVRIQPKGAIDLSKLSAGSLPPDALDHRKILSLKLRPTPVIQDLPESLPVTASILISSSGNTAAKGNVLDNVYLLYRKPEPDGISAIVAVTDADAQTLAAFIGKSEFIVMGPLH